MNNSSIGRREHIISTISGLALTLSGCVSFNTSDNNTPLNNSFEQKGASPSSGELCEGYSPLSPDWPAHTGPINGFDITVEQRNISIGDYLKVSLKNVSSSDNLTGNKKKYDIQYQNDGRWQSIIATEENAVHSDDGVSHPPGEGFQWELRFTKDGLSNSTGHPPTYYICGQIRPGNYRFIYWGIPDTEYGIGVPFTVNER